MKQGTLLPLCAVLLSSLIFAAPKTDTFTGEIMDPQCAANGSHATMLQKIGLRGKDPNDVNTKKMCTEICLKMGGKYVLYDSTSKRIYQLDDQNKLKQFAGQKVKVTGTLDKAGEKIHVTNFEPGS
jgi:hypothetical protein